MRKLIQYTKWIILSMILVLCSGIYSQETKIQLPINELAGFNPQLKKFIKKAEVTENGDTLICINFPGKPPKDYKEPIAAPTESAVILSNVPAYEWSFGCSATSGAMIAGYYDNTVDCSASGWWSGTDAGGKMKETGTVHWAPPNSGATNSSGFTGLPGGYCRTLSWNNTFYKISYYGR